MKKIVDDIRLIYKCCSLYYEKRMTQDKICAKLGISRATVSRLLEAGREQGIVEIKVHNPSIFQYGEIEQRLEEKYGLKEVIIVENDPLDSEHERNEKMSENAFDYLTQIMRRGDKIGVTMGRTLAQIPKVSKNYDTDLDLLFVPMFGGISQKRTGKKDVQSNHIAVEFAKKFHGDYVQFLSPAVFSNVALKDVFLKEESVRNIFDYFPKLNIAIMGIGVPKVGGTALVDEGYLDEKKLREFVDKGAVGDACLNFYDMEGNFAPFDDFNQRIAGISQGQLKEIDTRIGIAWGKEKAKAVLGAIHSESVNVLILDYECGTYLLSMDESSTIE